MDNDTQYFIFDRKFLGWTIMVEEVGGLDSASNVISCDDVRVK